jgi:multidrug resistance efflux pump
MSYRVEISREHALARKAVISQEAEVAESATQLVGLGEIRRQLRARLDGVEQEFAQGRIFAPISGIVSTKLARVGQSLVAGTAVAEVLDPRDVFVDWYIPSWRLFDPKVGNEVFVLFGNRRISATIVEILPVSDVYTGTNALLTSERVATQIARLRFVRDVAPPALNSSVWVRMYYFKFAATIAGMVIEAVRSF